MTYDHGVTLIKREVEYDDIGNPETIETRRDVLCRLNSIGTAEFYQASAQGMKPEVEFVIHTYEYEGESLVEFEGVEYKVLRTYRTGFEEVELTCERVIGDG